MTHSPDFSPERRATALSWIRGELLTQPDISDGARLMAAVGLLICDDSGRIKETDLESAMRDPSVIQAAATLLEEAATCL